MNLPSLCFLLQLGESGMALHHVVNLLTENSMYVWQNKSSKHLVSDCVISFYLVSIT